MGEFPMLLVVFLASRCSSAGKTILSAWTLDPWVDPSEADVGFDHTR
jgi:hypothetical protein